MIHTQGLEECCFQCAEGQQSEENLAGVSALFLGVITLVNVLGKARLSITSCKGHCEKMVAKHSFPSGSVNLKCYLVE